MRTLEVGDLFSGAGGSSTAALLALTELGYEPRLTAVNHWPVAISTHAENHPGARHLCADAYKLTPRDAVQSGRLDLLMASPTCTFNSRARGGKPISWDQRYGRMTPTQVLRWCRELVVQVLIVENVPEFIEWGPVDKKTGKPNRAKRGVYFHSWRRRLERLGYDVEHRILDAADFGDATNRKRFFLVGRRDGKPITWPAPTHSKTASPDMFGGGARPWRPAREIIDWSIRGRSIFEREKPLSPKTLLRILVGAIKHGWPVELVAKIRAHLVEVAARDGVELELPEVPRETHACAAPLVVRSAMHRSNSSCVRGDGEPLPTLVTRESFGLASPFVLSQGAGGAPRETAEPVPTIPARGAHALVVPCNGPARSVDEPIATATTRDRFALVTPVTHEDRSNRSRSVEEPLPTVTGAARGELAFVVGAFGERPGQAPRTRSVDMPAPTICAKGRVPLATAVEWDVEFRMLQPHELAKAMGFPDWYRFPAKKTDAIRLIGNAVAGGVARALVDACFSKEVS